MSDNNFVSPDGDEVVAETENYAVWTSQNEDETIYHIELGDTLTLHLLSDEWEELVVLIKSVE